MGLATSDPQSHKVQTKLYKMSKFTKKRMAIQTLDAIHVFANFGVFKSLYLSQIYK